MTSAATELAARTKQNETDIEVLTALRLNASAATNELIDDRVAALLVAGANVTLTYNDPANTLTVAASGGGGGGSGNSYFPGGWG